MTPLMLFFTGWLLAAVLLSILFLHELLKGDASIVDVGWSLGVGCLALYFAAFGGGDWERRVLAGVLGGIWAFRLAVYLFLNRVWGREEDGRYRRMRGAMGRWAHLGFFAFFQVQAFWAALFALPLLAISFIDRGGLVVWDCVGVVIWLIAVGGEALSDHQLARFRANPANKGRTCREGLWRYSRHPNYFFEWVHWFAYVAIAAGTGWWWVTLLGPALMLLFLFKVTGIPHTEKQALASRGDDYRRYQQTTSVFIPWFPKEDRPS